MEIAIISGKGGTGKSSISAAFATLQDEIVLADCDVMRLIFYLLFNPVCDEEYAFVSGQKAVNKSREMRQLRSNIDYCRFDAILEKDNKVTFLKHYVMDAYYVHVFVREKQLIL
jgi:MinD superfamily P-loop ATPase